MSSIYSPSVLCGPFGSLLARDGMTVAQAFGTGNIQSVRIALESYRSVGVTTPVTPTFGASIRGIETGRRLTVDQLRWIVDAHQLTKDVFSDSPYIASVAPILDTSGKDDRRWSGMTRRPQRAMRNYIPAFEAHAFAEAKSIIVEAVHDLGESIGAIRAALRAGLREICISFEPTSQGLPQNDCGLQTYGEVLNRLRDEARGGVEVSIGLNCGNAEQILDILNLEDEQVFDVVYPNFAVIPHGPEGVRFRELADKNTRRTPDEETHFASLQARYEISSGQRSRLITLGALKRVRILGLCCGAEPDAIGDFVREAQFSLAHVSHY